MWPSQHTDLFSNLDPLPDCWTEHTQAAVYKEADEPAVSECECGRRWRLLETGPMEVQRRGYL